MKDNYYEPFFYHSDVKLPPKFAKLVKAAKAEGKGFSYSILVIKDGSGNQYQLVLSQDKEVARKKFFLKNPFFDSYVNFLIRGFK
jgi:hypothetical protein